MYYIIFAGAGLEEKTENAIKKKIPQTCYTRCFHPVRHIKKKFGGVWKDCYDRLIPGYVFLESDNISEFYNEIKKNAQNLRILGKDLHDDSLGFYEMNENEEKWLKRLIGYSDNEIIGDNPVAEISELGYDENDEVTIISGPLVSLTGYIKKINRHKRIAEVEMEFMGRKTVMYLGIDMVVKNSAKQPQTEE